MTTIKSNATGTIYELPYEIAYEVMGDCYIEPSHEDKIDGIDACMENEEEIAWFARIYEAMEQIESAAKNASEEVRESVAEAHQLYGDWEDIQRNQCELLGLDLNAIYASVDIMDYEG